MEYFVGFLIGLAVGVALTVLLDRMRSRAATERMKDAFKSLAIDALDGNTDRLMQKVESDLEARKAAIDQSLKVMNERLAEVRRQLEEAEQKRQRDFGSLGRSVTDLSRTTGELHRILGSTQRRGMWGERMAEDVMNLAGLVEGVNYRRQSGRDAESGRPDFTFMLPNHLKLNMDVKFPLGHYKEWLDAPDDVERARRLKELVTALRGHVRAVARRGYIDPEAPTVDFVLVFLPSEQLLSVVLEAEPGLVDDALDMRVVLTSPLTLYAMLSVVRQAAENANVQRTAGEVI
ncbi:MAG: DNA recombination protein RmuC, partial [Deltaproteobacteria bacterium]|nr:DNA recombination protein RmuC [Deltaproteobacteria bacterium]